MSADIDSVMRHAPILAASDLFLREGEYAHARLDDRFQAFSREPLTREAMESFWHTCGADPQHDLDRDSTYTSPDGVRFRVSLHRNCGRLGAILRRLRHDVPNIEGLGLPIDELRRWVGRSPGLIMVCGPTGSGKSTTMAALLDEINHNNALHIVTIEDPIEFVFEQGASLITQRQVGIDTASFADGIRASLRQGVDLIMVGEVTKIDYELDHQRPLVYYRGAYVRLA
jgi:twitching motility protein PilT